MKLDKMTTREKEYGIFIHNDLLKDLSKVPQQRTALLGQVVIIDDKLPGKNLAVRYLKDAETWESVQFCCSEDNIVRISEKLWPFIASITSPQERIQIAKNKELCRRLQYICKDMVVGFTATDDIYLGKVKYIGHVKGMGYCYGIALHERRKGNNCNGSCAGIQYFTCLPGFGVFTTIEKIVIPNSFNNNCSNHATESLETANTFSDLDYHIDKNLGSLGKNMSDSKPKNEEIVTRYGEYPKKLTMPSRSTPSMRNSLSLQNMLDIGGTTINTNNDFDQNSVIQPEKTYLMAETKKAKNKSEVDLIDVIGTWSGTTDEKNLEEFSNFKKNLDKNDNIKGKYSTLEANTSNTLGRRNRSINPLSHFIDGNGTLKKSTAKFYINHDSQECKVVNKASPKSQISNKINERARSTFYLADEPPRYEEPPQGSTGDLAVGSLVEVLNDVSDEPLYGVVRWMGVEGAGRVLVGVELEEEHSHLPLELTDGVHKGQRLFRCADRRAVFVALEQCRRDSRFQDGAGCAVSEASTPERVIECPVIPGALVPLCMPTEEDVEAVCGKYRGIQGHHNSCYLDVTLFSMFTYSSVFDSLLFRPKDKNDIADYEEVQRVLREEIVNPLRKNLFVSADNVMKLRRLLDRLSSVSGLTSEEKDPEEFLNSLLAQILRAEPLLKLSSGQEAFHHQLFVEKDAALALPTVQRLFEQSFLTSDIKLKEVPACLIVQMPRFGKSYKMYPRILPSQLLDVTDVIEGSPRQCIVCGKLAAFECRECFDDCSSAGLESTAFCAECLRTAHRLERRSSHRPRRLAAAAEFAGVQAAYRPPRLYMELFAVVCIETSHYVAFAKCGAGHGAPWCFFDSMADRRGERNGYNIPEMVACPDISRWLSDDRICRQLHEEFPVDRHLPEHARRLLCDAYICMYQSPDVMMYR